MQLVQYISNLAMPFTIFIIILFGISEKVKIFDTFLEGAKEGMEIVINILPTLVGLFVVIGVLRYSGILDAIIRIAIPILNVIHFPTELMPLAMLRPISGSGAMAIAVDTMKTYGVDNAIGIMTSVIMGSTETTLYTIAIYTSCVKIKKTRGILVAALTADIIGILTSVAICRMIM